MRPLLPLHPLLRHWPLATLLAGLALPAATANALCDQAKIDRGRVIAERTCSICHVVGADHLPEPSFEDSGPDFRLMARKKNLTPDALAAKSGAGHGMIAGMAGTGLPADIAEDVAAYILSLGGK